MRRTSTSSSSTRRWSTRARRTTSSASVYAIRNGRTTEAYLRQARRHVSKDGLIIFPICNNSAYEVMDAIDLDYEIVGFELAYSGFWRAIVGARN